MKTTRIFIFALLASAIACHAQSITNSGWIDASRLTRTAPPTVMDSHTFAAIKTPAAKSFALVHSPYEPSAAIAETITPDIQTLAGGLENDPVRIFNYVHDHIRHVMYFGSKKGAELTLLEKSGNDFDQCALLVALLRAAGQTNVAYQFGMTLFPYDIADGSDRDLHHWLQLNLNNTDWAATSNCLVNLCYTRGYPTYNPTYGANIFAFQHVWVSLTMGGTNYQLDPSFKVSEYTSGINIPAAMGYNSNSLWTAAAGTETATYVTNLNEANLRNVLAGYTTNLLNYFQSNLPNAGVQTITGGWSIVPSTNTTLPTNLLFTVDEYGGSMPIQTWANEPTNMMSSLTITYAGTNYFWFIPQLQGQRITLTFDTNGVGQLRQEDTLIQQATTTDTGNTTSVGLAVNHPVGNWDFTNNVLIDSGDYDAATSAICYQRTNASIYVIQYAFEPDWGWLQKRQNQLAAYRQQYSPTSLQVVSETLNVIGLNWMLQSEAAENILASQLLILPQNFHRLGRVGQETGRGYFVDVYMQESDQQPATGVDDNSIANNIIHFAVKDYFSSALEHGVLEQMQSSNLVAASTVKMLQIANTNHQAVYLGYYGNWTSGGLVRSKLINYSADDLNTFDVLVSYGYFLLLPQNGSNRVAGGTGTWAGYGYVADGGGQSMGMIISGNYNGGFMSAPGSIDSAYVDQSDQNQPGVYNSTPTGTPNPTGADPVDMADGTFQVESTDLSLGQAEPRGLRFTRYYNGTRRNSNPAGMAGGWIHNYYANATALSAPEAGLGMTTPAQMAPMLAAICTDIGYHNPFVASSKNWMVTALIAKWGVDQLTHNGVSVTVGKDTLQFVKQPNGAFTPPANCTFTLLNTNSVYWLQERHGNTFKFNAAGLLTDIVDQYGQALTLTYNSSNWVSQAKDWKNRTLTFNYSGTPSQLTSVVDSSGRTNTLGYATTYNSQGDLTTVTDPAGNTSTFVYDTNHQITAEFDAANRLVVTNLYDGMGHVTTQYTAGDTNRMWQIFWSGWQTVLKDPAGAREDYFYDDLGRLTQTRDALTNNSYVLYDGQNHVALTISPLLETASYVYDGNHNLTNKIDALGFTNQFVYDNQNNLIRSIDGRGRTNSFGYNAKFQITGITNGAGDVATMLYNTTNGVLTNRTDGGGTTTYDYDSYGQLSKITYPNSLGSEGFLNSTNGDVLSHTNARGFVTSFQYSPRREMTNAIAPTNLTTRIVYDTIGNVSSTTDRRGLTTSNLWSVTRKLLATIQPVTPQGVPITTNVYDARDLLSRTINPLQNGILYTNDALGRLASVTDPMQRTTFFGYDKDGRTTATTNAATEVTRQEWDANGQLTKTTDAQINTVLRSYDGAGNQVILTNRNGKKWQFQFDAASRLTNTISPMNRQIQLTYDNRGELKTVRSPSAQMTTNFYDARGRLTNRVDAVASTIYRYDANSNPTNIAESGKSNTWVFDAYDHVSSYRDADGNLIQYRLDANGNLTNLIYPGGKTVTYFYDSLNRLTNVTDWANRHTSIEYDLAGHVTKMTRPNGTVRAVNYDVAGEITNIIEKTASSAPIAFFKLNYNLAARVQWEFAAPLPHPYTPPSRSMTYDDDNRIATFNGTNLVYDTDGNLTTGPLTNSALVTYTYDARNRLLNAGGIDYAYDPAGNRVGVTNGASVSRFVINPNAALSQVLMRVKDGVTTYYVYGLGLMYEADDAGNTKTYHYDYRGSTVALTDDNGNVTDRIEYSAYGLTTYRSGTSDTPFLYNGRFGVMTDPNGLLYMRARFYNPYLYRFISADPSGFAGGLNFYAYADGNPVSNLDPFGLDAIGENPPSSLLNLSSSRPGDFGTPCIECHGVSAFGYNGDPNSFSSYLPGSGPNAMEGYQGVEGLSVDAAKIGGSIIVGNAMGPVVSAGLGSLAVWLGDTAVTTTATSETLQLSGAATQTLSGTQNGVLLGTVENGEVNLFRATASGIQSHDQLVAQGIVGRGAQGFSLVVQDGQITVMRTFSSLNQSASNFNLPNETINQIVNFLKVPANAILRN